MPHGYRALSFEELFSWPPLSFRTIDRSTQIHFISQDRFATTCIVFNFHRAYRVRVGMDTGRETVFVSYPVSSHIL
ncbi:MAG TPA: hypothetical protein PLT82_13205 [Candidatus Hydrogenedens sp.]|nr:hypothetical protein [Candidatus Hydrogenedens sp.]HOK09676.1 hypothetical protein [Candidatus Hydrogenedens sp.]HOL19961.1 hypothetical protein [Candidatus Hydrogenedens sp.]HPP60081.1 hypothetical protein [Candidatus Hydrogenedens sp.]